MRKRVMAALMSGVMAGTLLAGCGGSTSTSTTTTAAAGGAATTTAGASTTTAAASGKKLSGDIEIVTNANEVTFNAVNEILQNFMKENPDVHITYTTEESDYENLMKARMASNDLPDIFATHGWSVARYSEYLRPLNDQPWYSSIKQTFLPIISNDSGQVFVLPLNQDSGGLFYNKKILKEIGKEVPTTWDELNEDCKLAKEKGYEGFFFTGKDSRSPANWLDIAATTYIVSRTDVDLVPSLEDGSFDWKTYWTPVSEELSYLVTNGYTNTDAATCDPVDLYTRLSENKSLFMMGSQQDLISRVKAINPDAEYGFAPVPALNGQEPALIGGEREAYGIWKDTKHEDVCLAILEYMAKPENVKAVCEASGKVPALDGVTADLGSIQDDINKYADVKTYGFFDRVYLPNGMWSTLKTIGSALLSGEMTVDETTTTMETDYKTLREQ